MRIKIIKGKSKSVPVTGRDGPYGCETKLPYFLDKRLTKGYNEVRFLNLT
jgi:hypothetical protein